MNADGTDVVPLSNDRMRSDNLPYWSPDGAKIAFLGDLYANGIWNLYVMNSDGSEVRLLLEGHRIDGVRIDGVLSWSPDGGQIVLVPS